MSLDVSTAVSSACEQLCLQLSLQELQQQANASQGEIRLQTPPEDLELSCLVWREQALLGQSHAFNWFFTTCSLSQGTCNCIVLYHRLGTLLKGFLALVVNDLEARRPLAAENMPLQTKIARAQQSWRC